MVVEVGCEEIISHIDVGMVVLKIVHNRHGSTIIIVWGERLKTDIVERHVVSIVLSPDCENLILQVQNLRTKQPCYVGAFKVDVDTYNIENILIVFFSVRKLKLKQNFTKAPNNRRTKCEEEPWEGKHGGDVVEGNSLRRNHG